MSLDKTLKLQKEYSEKISSLCKRPLANSNEQAIFWQDNYEEYLKEKAKYVSELPRELESSIDELYAENLNTYLDFVTSWYQHGYKEYQIYKLRKQRDTISKEELLKRKNEIKNTDYSHTDTITMTQSLFDIFEEMIQKMQNNEEWYDLYKASHIRGDGLVFNISSLDLFTWQLPSADLRDTNDYYTLAKIMTIFFFIEKIYKNESLISEINPFNRTSLVLEKIYAYYAFIKSIKDES